MKRELLLFVFVFRVLVLQVSLTSTSNRCKQMQTDDESVCDTNQLGLVWNAPASYV